MNRFKRSSHIPLSPLIKRLCLTLLLATSPLRSAEDNASGSARDQTSAFQTALKFLELGFDRRAIRELDRFIENHPEAEAASEAVLLKAQAHYRLEEYKKARNTFLDNLGLARDHADAFYYWQGEAYFQLKDYEKAAWCYRWLTRHFPDSPLASEAAYNEALAYYHQGELKRAVSLLRHPQRPFRRLGSPDDRLFPQGMLLLAEALWALGDYERSLAVLNRLSSLSLTDKLAWKADFLKARVYLAQNDRERTLSQLTTLEKNAKKLDSAQLMSEAQSLLAAAMERFGQPDKAIKLYDKLLADGSSGDSRRDGLLKAVSLRLTHGEPQNAVAPLAQYLEAYPDDRLADLLKLTLGELYLRQYYGSQDSKSSNQALLSQAKKVFAQLHTQYPDSPLRGRAYLNQGWCYWEGEALDQSHKAFEEAADRLEAGNGGLIGQIKLADIHFRQGDIPKALPLYDQLLTRMERESAPSHPAKSRVRHQLLRAHLELGQLDEAASQLQAPKKPTASPYHDANLLLVAQAANDQQRPKEARNWLQRLFNLFTRSELTPQARLALARSYVESGEWQKAIAQYDRWLKDFPDHSLAPRVEFDRAWVHYQAGHGKKAFALFQTFHEEHPDHPKSPQAQFWIADYYLRHNHNEEAEREFQMLYQNTNSPPSKIKYQARLMAGKAAMARQGYKDAQDYFSWLVTHGPSSPQSDIPTNIVAKAYFALGDSFIEAPPGVVSTDKLSGFGNAINAFSAIRDKFPNHELVSAAVTRIGDCHLQLASKSPDRYKQAIASYREVLQIPQASVRTRSEAQVGLGLALEKQARDTLSDPKQLEQLNKALDHYLNVFTGKMLDPNETADTFWVHKAGIEAARLARELQHWDQTEALYRKLIKLFPQRENAFRQQLAQIQEQRAE